MCHDGSSLSIASPTTIGEERWGLIQWIDETTDRSPDQPVMALILTAV
jgi:hypothetical protein